MACWVTLGEECSREESILGGGSLKIHGPLPGSLQLDSRGCPTQRGPLVTFDEGQEGRPGLLSFPDLKFFNILSRSCSETRFHVLKQDFISSVEWRSISVAEWWKFQDFCSNKIYRIFKQREFDSVLPSFTDLLFFFLNLFACAGS